MRLEDIEYDEKNYELLNKLSIKEIYDLFEVALYYADKQNYFAIGFLSDLPCGDFINDFDEEDGKPGEFARSILKPIMERLIPDE